MAMLPARRRLRRRERARRRRFLVGALVTLALILGSLVQLSRLPPPQATEAHTGADPSSDLLAMATTPLEESEAGEQPAFPYSIIPGGARSAEALRKAIDADPVVRAHYANFDLAKVHVVRLTEPRVAHVSYRLGDHVFWTRRPLLLKADETLLTDGVHYARTRCGNQLAVTPGAISGSEPSAEALDAPVPVPRSTRVFPSIRLPADGGAASIAGSGVPGMPFGGGGIPIGSVPFGAPPSTVLTELAPVPAFFGSGVGRTGPPFGTANTDDPPAPPRLHVDDTPPEQTDDPHTPQVPEPGLTLMMLGGGVLWARRRRAR